MSLKFCFLRWCQLVCFRHSLIDYQNTRQFFYCLSANQIFLYCRSLDWSALINSFLLQTRGAGRGLLIKERTSEMVNKLRPDSAGDAQSVLPAGDVLAHQWLQVLLSVLLGRWKQTHEGGMLKSRETLPYQNSLFLYQLCVFLWWKVSRSTLLGWECIKFIGEKQKICLLSRSGLGFSLICRGGHTVDQGWIHPGLSQSNFKCGHFSLLALWRADIAWVPRLFYLQITVKSTLRLQRNCLGNFSKDFASEVKPLENLPEIAAWNKVCAQ